jgi:hypothetical protein
MLLQLIASVSAANISEPAYSLLSPFAFTAPDEIGNWTFRGSATNLKSFIRLTTQQPGQYGAVCNRVPTNFKEWNVEIEFNAFGGNQGRGFWFTFSEEPCVRPGRHFHGFTVRMPTDTMGANWDSWYPVFIAYSNYTKADTEGVCSIATRSDASRVAIRVTRTGDKIGFLYRTLDADYQDPDFFPCVDTVVSGLPDFGYFSFSAMTTKAANDDHDLFRVYTESRSPKTAGNGTDFSALNRKRFENRRHQKFRKSGAMPLTKSYLAGTNVTEFSDSLRLVNESLWRANRTVKKDLVDKVVNSSVLARIESLQKHLRVANLTFSELRPALDGIWKDFEKELLAVQADVREQMGTTKEDLIKYTKILVRGQEDTRGEKAAYREALREMTDPRMSVLMLVVCFVETLAFCTFFVRRLRRSRAIKKEE